MAAKGSLQKPAKGTVPFAGFLMLVWVTRALSPDGVCRPCGRMPCWGLCPLRARVRQMPAVRAAAWPAGAYRGGAWRRWASSSLVSFAFRPAYGSVFPSWFQVRPASMSWPAAPASLKKTAEASLWLVPAVMRHAMVRGLSKIFPTAASDSGSPCPARSRRRPHGHRR